MKVFHVLKSTGTSLVPGARAGDEAIQTLALGCTVSVTRSLECAKLGACLSCNAAVFIVFPILILTLSHDY